MNQDLVSYIKESRSRGLAEDLIKAELKKVGWEDAAIAEAFGDSQGSSPVLQVAPSLQTQPVVQATLTQKPLTTEPSSITPDHKPSVLRRVMKIVLVVLILAVAVGAALGYFIISGKKVFGYSMEDKIWQTLFTSKEILMADQSFKVSYQDTGEFNFVPSKFIQDIRVPDQLTEEELEEFKQEDENYSFTIKDFGTQSDLAGFLNITDKTKPKYDVAISGFMANNDTRYEANLAVKSNDSLVTYYKVGVNDAIKKWYESLIPNSTEEVSKYLDKWIKTEASDGESLSSLLPFESVFGLYNSFPNDATAQSEQEQKVLDILKANRLISIKSLKGVSLQGYQPLLHYELTLDKDKLKNAFAQMVKDTASEEDDQFNKFGIDLMNVFIDKWEISEFEVWVGAIDHRTYKTKFASKLPSVAGVLNALYDSLTKGALHDPVKGLFFGMEETQNNSRDAKRVADVRQLMTAYELYFNDNGHYPLAQDGKAVGLDATYMPTTLIAPTPLDGSCNDFYNTYWYTALDGNGAPTTTTPSRYTLTFCIGEPTGGLSSGILVATESGVTDYTCPADNAGCQAIQSTKKPATPIEDPSSSSSMDDSLQVYFDAILDLMRNTPFSATQTIESELKNVGQDRTVEAPPDFIEIPKPEPLNSPYNPNPESLEPTVQGV